MEEGISKVQLYSQLKFISKAYREDRDGLGVFVGGIIISGLVNFKSKSKSKQERKFEEVKSIYRKFEEVFREYNYQIDNEKIYGLQSKVNERITNFEKTKKNTRSELLERIIHSIKRKEGSYDDRLRRMGLDLFNRIMDKGEIDGTNKKKMNIDYENVEYCFTRKKGDRR